MYGMNYASCNKKFNSFRWSTIQSMVLILIASSFVTIIHLIEFEHTLKQVLNTFDATLKKHMFSINIYLRKTHRYGDCSFALCRQCIDTQLCHELGCFCEVDKRSNNVYIPFILTHTYKLTHSLTHVQHVYDFNAYTIIICVSTRRARTI